MEMVSSRVTCWNYPQGNRLITQGHKGSAFYILNSGEVSIQIKQGMFGKKKEVASLKPGQLFGEISLILDQKCTADVVASDNVEVFVFTKELFQFLIENNEPFRKPLKRSPLNAEPRQQKIDDRGADRTKYGLLLACRHRSTSECRNATLGLCRLCGSGLWGGDVPDRAKLV